MIPPERQGLALFVARRALLARLRERAAVNGGGMWGVNVLPRPPVTKDEIRTAQGAYEIVYAAQTAGAAKVQVMTAGMLRFDETVTMTLRIEVIGRSSSDDQDVMDARVNQLIFEVLAEVAAQKDWDLPALGLDVFEYFWMTPESIEIVATRLESSPGAGAGCSLGLTVNARRSYQEG